MQFDVDLTIRHCVQENTEIQLRHRFLFVCFFVVVVWVFVFLQKKSTKNNGALRDRTQGIRKLFF